MNFNPNKWLSHQIDTPINTVKIPIRNEIGLKIGEGFAIDNSVYAELFFDEKDREGIKSVEFVDTFTFDGDFSRSVVILNDPIIFENITIYNDYDYPLKALERKLDLLLKEGEHRLKRTIKCHMYTLQYSDKFIAKSIIFDMTDN